MFRRWLSRLRGGRRLERCRIAFVSSRYGTVRHTCEHAREQLRYEGIDSDLFLIERIDPRVELAPYDVVVLNRVPLTPELHQLMAAGRLVGKVFVFDLDDLLLDEKVVAALPFVQDRSQEDQQALLAAVGEFRATLSLCSHVLCYTRGLEEELALRGHRPVRIALCVSQEMVELSLAAAAEKSGRGVTIGYAAGHSGHTYSFRTIEEPLLDLLSRYPDLRLTVMGSLIISSRFSVFGDRVIRVPPMDWRMLPAEIAKLDVALAPLEDHSFNHSKSHLKYCEAGLCQVPIVAARVGQYVETIEDGVTGFLASSQREWVERLEVLLLDGNLRRSVGERARQDVLTRWTTRAQSANYREALERIVREA